MADGDESFLSAGDLPALFVAGPRLDRSAPIDWPLPEAPVLIVVRRPDRPPWREPALFFIEG